MVNSWPGQVLEVKQPGFRVGYRNTGEGKQETARKLVSALKQCSKTKDLKSGAKLHAEAVAASCHTDKYVAAALVNMYTKCGNMQCAREVFNGTVDRDAVMWNSLLLGYVENGQSSIALDLFTRMNCEPTHVTYVAALKACSSLATEKESGKQFYLEKGISLHEQHRDRGFECNKMVSNSLVDMYAKCGSMQLSRKAFESILHKDVVTWTCLILGYVENREYSVALDLFSIMNCSPTYLTYIAALKACAGLAMKRPSEKQLYLSKGVAIHGKIKDHRYDTNILVAGTLVDMYGKCGKMQLAQEVFDTMLHKNIIVWNCLLMGYVGNGQSALAMDLLLKLDCTPDSYTYVAGIKACTCLAAERELEKQCYLEKGINIHKQVIDQGFDSHIVVASALIDMYGKCGSMWHARQVFEKLVHKDVIAWSSLILGYVENAESSVALDLFMKMECEPIHVTYVTALKACVGFPSETLAEKQFRLEKGVRIHKQLRDQGFETDVAVANTLVHMYGKCGSMQHALDVFDKMVCKDVITWTALMEGYVENGECLVALDVFNRMDCAPTHVTYVAAIKACAGLAMESKSEKQLCIKRGISIHQQVKDGNFDTDMAVANSLVVMYGKCGSMQHAREVFDGMINKDVVTWNCILMGYVENGDSSTAMDLFMNMNCEPMNVTYVAAIKACGAQAALSVGRAIHNRICMLGLEQDQVLATTLMDFYSKGGCISTAEVLFSGLQSPSIVSWNVLISGYSRLGESSRVFSLVKRAEETGLQMDDITLICILTACSHMGLVDEGKTYLESMSRNGIKPALEHYTCMIDMLGRANRLDEALSLVRSMPFKADSVTWMSLLEACKKRKNMEVGKIAFDALVATDTPAAYVLMADMWRPCRQC